MQQLLAVIDHGEAAQRVVRVAARWAQRSGAQLSVFLPVALSMPKGLELGPGLLATVEHTSEMEAMDWLQTFLEQHHIAAEQHAAASRHWVRAHVEATARREVRRAEVIEEHERPDHAPLRVRQQPAHHEAVAEIVHVTGQQQAFGGVHGRLRKIGGRSLRGGTHHARRYCRGVVISAPSALAARRGKYGSRSSSRARITTSAWPLARMVSACTGSLIMPTAPTATPVSRRIVAASGT